MWTATSFALFLGHAPSSWIRAHAGSHTVAWSFLQPKDGKRAKPPRQQSATEIEASRRIPMAQHHHDEHISQHFAHSIVLTVAYSNIIFEIWVASSERVMQEDSSSSVASS